MNLLEAYQVLGLLPGADEATVRAVFKSKAKGAHPDSGGSTSAFKAIEEAAYVIDQAGYPPPATFTAGHPLSADPGERDQRSQPPQPDPPRSQVNGTTVSGIGRNESDQGGSDHRWLKYALYGIVLVALLALSPYIRDFGSWMGKGVMNFAIGIVSFLVVGSIVTAGIEWLDGKLDGDSGSKVR